MLFVSFGFFFQLVPDEPGKKCFDLVSSSSKMLLYIVEGLVGKKLTLFLIGHTSSS